MKILITLFFVLGMALCSQGQVSCSACVNGEQICIWYVGGAAQYVPVKQKCLAPITVADTVESFLKLSPVSMYASTGDYVMVGVPACGSWYGTICGNTICLERQCILDYGTPYEYQYTERKPIMLSN